MPHRLTVPPPESGESPPGKRFARIPFALAVVNETAFSVVLPKTFDQLLRKPPLGRTERTRVPFGAIHIAAGNEGGLHAHGETNIALEKGRIDLCSKRVNPCPLFFGVRLS